MRAFRKAGAVIGLSLLLAGPGSAISAETVYSIQVAAFTDKSQADQNAEGMNRMGHHAFVRLENVPGKGMWHRVYVERFGSKEQAAKEAAALKSLGLLNDYLIRPLKDDLGPRKE